MLYMYKVIDGRVAIYYAGGLTHAELSLATESGWTTYWTTDSKAGADAHRLAGIAY